MSCWLLPSFLLPFLEWGLISAAFQWGASCPGVMNSLFLVPRGNEAGDGVPAWEAPDHLPHPVLHAWLCKCLRQCSSKRKHAFKPSIYHTASLSKHTWLCLCVCVEQELSAAMAQCSCSLLAAGVVIWMLLPLCLRGVCHVIIQFDSQVITLGNTALTRLLAPVCAGPVLMSQSQDRKEGVFTAILSTSSHELALFSHIFAQGSSSPLAEKKMQFRLSAMKPGFLWTNSRKVK